MPPRKAASTVTKSPSKSVSAESSSNLRRSSRTRAPPRPFRPNISGRIPNEFSTLIRDVAVKQAKQCEITIESTALSTLEDALEQVLERMFDLAAQNAKKQGRDSIIETDLQYANKLMNFKKIEDEADKE